MLLSTDTAVAHEEAVAVVVDVDVDAVGAELLEAVALLAVVVCVLFVVVV